jgi:hypothetical protein
MLENLNLDEGTPTWRPGPADLTRLDSGELPAEALLNLAGAEGEEALFTNSPTGRMTAVEFEALVSDLRTHGMRYPVTVHVEQDGRVWIQEGNHRLRAGHRAGIPISVEIKYFGNSQRQGLIFPVS